MPMVTPSVEMKSRLLKGSSFPDFGTQLGRTHCYLIYCIYLISAKVLVDRQTGVRMVHGFYPCVICDPFNL